MGQVRISTGDWAATHDAAYVIEPIEYVDPSPPLETSLLKDSKRLKTLMSLTIKSILARTDEDVGRIIQAAHEEGSDQGNGESSYDHPDGGPRNHKSSTDASQAD